MAVDRGAKGDTRQRRALQRLALDAGGSSTVAFLNDIGDVSVPTPGDGEVLTWDSGSSLWIAAPSVVTSIDWSDVLNTPTTLAGYGITDAVPNARTISTAAPLSGGGDLSANRTITTSMTTNRLIGRTTAGTGVMEEIAVGTNLSLSAGVLNGATVGSSGGSPLFGDGSDGAVDFDGTNTYAFASKVGNVYTITRDVFCTTMIVRSGVTVIAEFRLLGTVSLVNSGTIQRDGNVAVANARGENLPRCFWNACGVGGAAPGSGTTTQAGSSATQAGVNNGLAAMGGQGGDGGNANGGNSGTLLPLLAFSAGFGVAAEVLSQHKILANTSGSTGVLGPIGYVGGSGGGGGGRTTGGTATTPGGGGGGGQVLLLAFNAIDNSAGTISAKGGNGANATGGTCVTGGGGGGGGGWIVLIYHTFVSGTQSVAGGTKGTGLNGAAAAQDGSAGLITQIVVP